MAAAASLSPPPPLRCPWTKAKRAVHCGCASTRFLSSCADSFGSQPILANVPPCLSTSAAAAAVAAKEEEEEASKEEEEADSAPPPTKAKLCARSFSAVPNTVTVTSIAQAFLCFFWVFFLFFLLFPVASVAGSGFRWGGELGGVAAAPGVAALSVFLGDGTGTSFFGGGIGTSFFRGGIGTFFFGGGIGTSFFGGGLIVAAVGGDCNDDETEVGGEGALPVGAIGGEWEGRAANWGVSGVGVV